MTIAEIAAHEEVVSRCEWEGGCGQSVDGLVTVEVLVAGGVQEGTATETMHAGLCELHWTTMLALDAARPVFWQVTEAELLKEGAR